MSKCGKIVLFLVLAVAVAIVVAFGLYAWWARPGRVSEDGCRDLVRTAWGQAQAGSPSGEREFEYRLARRVYRVRVDPAQAPRYPVIARILTRLFRQAEPAGEFLGRLDIRHAGRVRVAGAPCERVRLSPREYKGDSVELWIDPGRGYLLGWRRLDGEGRMVRGYRFRTVTGFEERAVGVRGDEIEGDGFEGSPLFEMRRLMSPEEIEESSQERGIPLPEWLPSGFSMTGGRMTPALELPHEFEGILPGMQMGRMRSDARMMGPGMRGAGGGHLQVIYSDGLNTISVVMLPMGRFMQFAVDPGRAQEVLDAKAKEMRRIHHTSIVARVFPGSIVLLFGEVAPDVLARVADSIRSAEPEQPPGLLPPQVGPEGFGPPSDRRHIFEPRRRREGLGPGGPE